jgi:hypothetical protein
MMSDGEAATTGNITATVKTFVLSLVHALQIIC